MTTVFHHLDVTVFDPAKSRPLYELFLGHYGFTLNNAGDTWAGFGLGGTGYPCITLLKAKGRNAARKHDRYAPSLHHLALPAKSRADVDALYRKLKKSGADIVDAPAEYPDYGKGYHAVFFLTQTTSNSNAPTSHHQRRNAYDGDYCQARMIATVLVRWSIGLTVALGATLMYALALAYSSPDALLQFGRIAGFVCLTVMFAGVVFLCEARSSFASSSQSQPSYRWP